MELEEILRKLSLIPIGIVIVVQAAYGLFVCETEIWIFAIVTGVILIPAFIWQQSGNFGGTFGFCLGLLPWLFWANHVECVAPYQGGGAAMAYVAVFLWGGLSGLVLGYLFSRLQKRVVTIEIANK